MKAIWLVLGLAISIPAHSDEYLSSGDWKYSLNDPEGAILEATTTASGGEVMLSQVCVLESKDCIYMVNFDVTCEEDSKLPALVNTDKGALTVTLLCTDTKATDGTNYMIIQPFDEFDGALRGAKRLGFVVPMEEDEFRAVRFSMRGAVGAIDRMRAAANRSKTPTTVEGRPAVQRL